MMNMTRGEKFTLELELESDAAELESLALRVVQGGRTVLRREKEDAAPDADGRRVWFAFDERETAALQSGQPAYAQARAVLRGGGVIRSGVEEICVIDAVCAGKEEPCS